MSLITFAVSGMACGGCVNRVKNALQEIEGISRVDAILESGLVSIEYDEKAKNSAEKFRCAIEDLGFSVSGPL